jgi:hypothetical protein
MPRRCPIYFPWANLHVDEDAASDADEDAWMEETCMWDGEEQRYIGNSEDFGDWYASRYPTTKLRPIGESAGEVAHWRLLLTLNDLGKAVVALERYLARHS